MESMSDHIVICGWHDGAIEIVRQVQEDVVRDRREIVVVCNSATDRQKGAMEECGVRLLEADPADKQALSDAGIRTAARAIILADRSAGKAADARSILIALAIEALNDVVHTVVELIDSSNRLHFERTKIDEIVCVSEIGEKLLAQSALTHGLTDFYTHLLTTSSDTNEIYVVEIDDRLQGKTFCEILDCLREEDFLVIGLRSDGVTAINPRLSAEAPQGYTESGMTDRDTYKLKEGDQLVVISYAKPHLGD